MDITLSKTQQDIIKEARRFLKKECPPEYVQEMFLDEVGFTDELWKKMKRMDWMALRVPEAYGGTLIYLSILNFGTRRRLHISSPMRDILYIVWMKSFM